MGSPFCARSCVHRGDLCTMRLHFLATSAATATGQLTGRLVQPRGWIFGVELTELLGKLEGDIVRCLDGFHPSLVVVGSVALLTCWGDWCPVRGTRDREGRWGSAEGSLWS